MSNLIQHISLDEATTVLSGTVHHFGDTASELKVALETSGKCPMGSLGVVSVSGSDSIEFLNAQFTTDCTQLSSSRSQLSGWCDPKGRVLFLFTLSRIGDSVFVMIARRQIAKFLSRLQMYVLRADVEIKDCSDDKSIFGLLGNESINGIDITGLMQPWDSVQADGTMIIRYGYGHERYLFVSNNEPAIEMWTSLTASNVGEDVWTAFDGYTGFPRLGERSYGEFLPQQLNLDCLDSVSFSKGCYPGQEIIARLKYRGEVKKRLRAFSHNSINDVPDGTRILESNGEKLSGHVLYSQRVDTRQAIAAGIIDVDTDIGSLILDGHSDAQLQELAIPYSLD